MPDIESSTYIYADNAATTPLSPVAREAMLPYLGASFGNPGGIHRVAKAAARTVSEARTTCAECLEAHPREIFFTSGGSESDVWALVGCTTAWQRRSSAQSKSDSRLGTEPTPNNKPFTIITSSIEHHAILYTCDALKADDVRIMTLPVDTEGFVDPTVLDTALTQAKSQSGNTLVSIMLANNEVGTIQDIAKLARITHAHGALFHTDAVQAVGHIPVNVATLGVDLLSASAHKFHGPTGCGLLYIKTGTPIAPIITGGAQQDGMRSGTENLAGIVGMATALKEAVNALHETSVRVASARQQLTSAILTACPEVIPTGPHESARRLPSIASFICPNVDAELLMVILDKAGIAASTGSACSAGSTEPSHVLRALDYTEPSLAFGSLRLSLADNISDADVAYLCKHVPACIKQAKATSGGNLSHIKLF